MKSFPNNFRCKSFTQSYDMFHSKDYFNTNFAVMRAKILIDTYLSSRIIEIND